MESPNDNINQNNNPPPQEELLIAPDLENDEDIKKGHRRSKNDVEGRTYKCKLCGKSYLSYPALYTHSKQKHNTCNTSGRGRGRPKKEMGELTSERMQFNPLTPQYFSKPERSGKVTDYNKCINKAFESLYDKSNKEILERNNSKKLEDYSSVNDHPFLSKYMENSHDPDLKIENENEICDNVFMDYLNKMSIYTNDDYFSKLIRFVTLFRIFVNIMKKNDDKVEYTTTSNAEDVPDISNEFINDFIEPEKNFFDFTKEECIDLTQNFCHWMYENNFTCSKLSLINTSRDI